MSAFATRLLTLSRMIRDTGLATTMPFTRMLRARTKVKSVLQRHRTPFPNR